MIGSLGPLNFILFSPDELLCVKGSLEGIVINNISMIVLLYLAAC